LYRLGRGVQVLRCGPIAIDGKSFRGYHLRPKMKNADRGIPHYSNSVSHARASPRCVGDVRANSPGDVSLNPKDGAFI
jgi:hypothetical protein